MDTLGLSTGRISMGQFWSDDDRVVDVVSIFINDRNMIDLIRELELPFARREGHPDLAGSYLGLPPDVMLFPSRYLLGEGEDFWDDDGKVSLYGCVCGEVGCWPLRATVTVTLDTVVWSDFEQPHRGPDYPVEYWKYDHFGPFVFNRAQYEAQLAGGATSATAEPR